MNLIPLKPTDFQDDDDGIEQVVVLVVEDDILISEAISVELQEAGYTVLTAENADEAVLLLETRPDIVYLFTDIDMPGSMNGLKLAAAVRKRWPPVKIVITTGMSRPMELPEGAGFLPKPYRYSDVIATFKRL